MSELSGLDVPTQPLRRIVRPTPIARQRKMTIGRIAAVGAVARALQEDPAAEEGRHQEGAAVASGIAA